MDVRHDLRAMPSGQEAVLEVLSAHRSGAVGMRTPHAYASELDERALERARRRVAGRYAEPEPETVGDFLRAFLVALMLVAAGIAMTYAAVGYASV